MKGAIYWFNLIPESKERLVISDYKNAEELSFLLEKGVPEKIRMKQGDEYGFECHMIIRWNDYDSDDMGVLDIVDISTHIESRFQIEDFYIHFGDNQKDQETEIKFIFFIQRRN